MVDVDEVADKAMAAAVAAAAQIAEHGFGCNSILCLGSETRAHVTVPTPILSGPMADTKVYPVAPPPKKLVSRHPRDDNSATATTNNNNNNNNDIGNENKRKRYTSKANNESGSGVSGIGPTSDETDAAKMLLERNREHARRTRLRKKANLQLLKLRISSLEEESKRLKQSIEECKIASILLGISSSGATAGSVCSAATTSVVMDEQVSSVGSIDPHPEQQGKGSGAVITTRTCSIPIEKEAPSGQVMNWKSGGSLDGKVAGLSDAQQEARR